MVTGGAPSSATLFTSSPSMGELASLIIPNPDLVPALGWQPSVLCFDAAGYLYVLWKGLQSGLGYHCLQKRNPTTFALIQEWKNFDSAAYLGGNIQAGAISPNGKYFYYSWGDAGQTNRNQLRIFNTITNTPSTFATYGTWDESTGTGFTFILHCFRVDFAGNIFAVLPYLIGNTPSGSRLIQYTASGILHLDYNLGNSAFTESFAVAPNNTSAWVAFHNTGLSQYQLSTGALLRTTASNSFFYGDVIIQGTPDIPDQVKACIIEFPLE